MSPDRGPRPRYYGGGADTFLLLEAVLAYGVGGRRVLELGCGRGLLSIACAGQGATVTATDVMPGAVRALEERALELGLPIRAIESDLFDRVDGEFDVIAMNPPYVPSDALPPRSEDDPLAVACSGGAKGRAIIDPLLSDIGAHLAQGPDSRLFLLVCTDNDVDEVRALAARVGLESRVVAQADVPRAEQLRVLEVRWRRRKRWGSWR